MDNTPLLKVNKACDDSVLWAIQRLDEVGYHAMRTFDLQTARLAHFNRLSTAPFDCPCPHHGTETCDCQMVVLLVYTGKQKPVTMLVHGSHRESWFYLVNTPQQPVEDNLEKTIQEALSMETDLLVLPTNQQNNTIRRESI